VDIVFADIAFDVMRGHDPRIFVLLKLRRLPDENGQGDRERASDNHRA